MKSLMKFGAILLGFGVILSMAVIMIIRSHAVSAATVKTPTTASPQVASSPAAKN